jgi:hypothetical protein
MKSNESDSIEILIGDDIIQSNEKELQQEHIGWSNANYFEEQFCDQP